jgi:hypothetical protein
MGSSQPKKSYLEISCGVKMHGCDVKKRMMNVLIVKPEEKKDSGESSKRIEWKDDEGSMLYIYVWMLVLP